MSEQQNGKTVRLDKEVIDKLAKKRVGFENPNECIKRLLMGSCNSTKTNPQNEEDEEDENS